MNCKTVPNIKTVLEELKVEEEVIQIFSNQNFLIRYFLIGYF